ncbi:MAG: efflux transporter periplasmic adaptor subunit [Rhizobiales bacterium PAR1]|nr:MAG: efflux transporter periplasmic adaptor subunit [Rhizobiales bacterium PAR1]
MKYFDAPARGLTVLLALSPTLPALGGEFLVKPTDIIETKAVYGRIEARDVIPARSRIGGTLTRLDVTEGDAVTAGQSIATVIDDKLALQLRAAEARIRALNAEQSNARAELERAQTLLTRGSSTQQRVDQLSTQLDVFKNQIAAAEADRSVILQQAAEGEVAVPVSGRIFKVPVTRGAVVMPGEPIAQIAGGGFFLRLALPERHANDLKLGASVTIGETGGASPATGKLAKIFPQIENGRVIADVEVEKPGDYFVGARVLVHVPIRTRSALAVPKMAVRTQSGVDFLTLSTPGGKQEIAVVLGPPVPLKEGEGIEILSGVRADDKVILP